MMENNKKDYQALSHYLCEKKKEKRGLQRIIYYNHNLHFIFKCYKVHTAVKSKLYG